MTFDANFNLKNEEAVLILEEHFQEIGLEVSKTYADSDNNLTVYAEANDISLIFSFNKKDVSVSINNNIVLSELNLSCSWPKKHYIYHSTLLSFCEFGKFLKNLCSVLRP